VYFLKNGETLDDKALPATIDDAAIREAVEELMVLSKPDLEREIYEGREKMRRDENRRMRHALQQGLQQGRSEREDAGIEKGKLIGQILLLQPCLGSSLHRRKRCIR